VALRRALLIAALLLAASTRLAAAAPRDVPSCLACHATRHWAVVASCTGCHRGDARAARAGVAHTGLLRGPAAAWRLPHVGAVRDGEWLRDVLGCRRCHVTGGAGGALAISLDAIAWRREQDDLRRSIQHPATFMPDFGLATWQADRLIALLLRDGQRAAREERYLVRFGTGGAPARANAFVTRCGPCHRALTSEGPLGAGSAGPNLSGLLGGFYPRTDGRAWDRARLERWVKNPRAENPRTTMAPVALEAGELDAIARLLGAGSPAPGAIASR